MIGRLVSAAVAVLILCGAARPVDAAQPNGAPSSGPTDPARPVLPPPRPAASDEGAPTLRDPKPVKPQAAALDPKPGTPKPGPDAGAEPFSAPTRLLREKTVAPHTSPGVTIGGDDKTTLGLFGDVNPSTKIDPRTIQNLRPARDVGAGLTWQYRFKTE